MSFPRTVAKVSAPPLKCQGIKTKLVPFIARSVTWSGKGVWIEPFSGSSVVALNLLPNRARLYDSNPHIVNVYTQIQQRVITPQRVRTFLETEGKQLRRSEGEYYYVVRERFNQRGQPLDYLFLNRACFNGLVRFNKKGQFNVPFCKKPERFRPAYITKIVNQVAWVQQQLHARDWRWIHGDWRQALEAAEPDDFVYMDPPYIGRHADYFSQWTDSQATELAARAQQLPCRFALSMWLKNKYRTNTHLAEHWGWANQVTTEHFYHVGPSERLRNKVVEALVLDKAMPTDPVHQA